MMIFQAKKFPLVKNYILLRALKSPQKFRTPSSANFFGFLTYFSFKIKILL